MKLSPFNVLPSFCTILYFKIRLLYHLEFSKAFFEKFWPEIMHFGSLCKVFFHVIPLPASTINCYNGQYLLKSWNIFFRFGPFFVFFLPLCAAAAAAVFNRCKKMLFSIRIAYVIAGIQGNTKMWRPPSDLCICVQQNSAFFPFTRVIIIYLITMMITQANNKSYLRLWHIILRIQSNQFDIFLQR